MFDVLKPKRLGSLRTILILIALLTTFSIGRLFSCNSSMTSFPDTNMPSRGPRFHPGAVYSPQTGDDMKRPSEFLHDRGMQKVQKPHDFAPVVAASSSSSSSSLHHQIEEHDTIADDKRQHAESQTPRPPIEIYHEVKNPEPLKVHQKSQENKESHTGESKKLPTGVDSHKSKDRSPPKSTTTDYYGTGTDGHFAGLKKLGWSSALKHSFKSLYIQDPHVYSSSTIRKAPGYRKKKLIACYNCPQRFFKSNHFNQDFKQCPYSECQLSQGAGMNENASMMLFWQDPESDPPKRPPGQPWVFLSWESPPNRAYPRPADKWKDQFNYTMSYLRDAEFSMPYDHLMWRDESLLYPDSHYVEAAKKKTKMAAWWVSNCKTKSNRRAYVDEMKKYIPDIDIYGNCGSFVCGKDHGSECWARLNTTYRFYIGFENSFCPEYVTEKFYKIFRYRFPVIPIVRGSFEYDKYFPKDILISTSRFASAKDLAFHLIDLSRDPVRLGKMYKEKDRFGILNRKMDWCDFCEKLHTGGFPKRIIHDVKEFSHQNSCSDPPNDVK